MERNDAASLTAMMESIESILITTTIDAMQKQCHDVMTANILNAFVQMDVDEKNQVKGERIIIKIRALLVDMLLKIAPKVYEGYSTNEGKTKVLYIKMLKAIYGMLQSSLLYYKKFHKDIESIGFEVNSYDPCVANHILNGTVSWHIDDLKSSHVDRKVNDQFLEWLKRTYASQ
jgi:hypothetical protein